MYLFLRDVFMKKSNITYVLYQTFSYDLLFWIVVSSLFLTNVKGLDSFQIVLVTLIGVAASIACYPLTNLIVKKTTNKFSLILGALLNIFAVIMFMVSQSIFGIAIGQIMANLSTPFKEVSSLMLKNNLKEQNKEEDFVKWDSYGRLGYAIITMMIALCSGVLFNIHHYLPMYLTLLLLLVGLIIALIYTEPKTITINQQKQISTFSLLSKKVIKLILFMNVFTVGIYVFLHEKATLIIQLICEEGDMELNKISIVVSGIVLGSRIAIVLANAFFPTIYKTAKNKNRLMYYLCALIIIASLSFAIGANIDVNIVYKLVFVAIGLFIVIGVRDCYATIEKKIIVSNLEEQEQKQAFVLAGIFMKCGKLCSNIFALIVLGFTPLNVVYIYLLVFTIVHISICVPLGKYLKHNRI